MKILHIENDPDFVMFFKENLEPFGFEIINIDSPEDAIVHFRNNPEAYDIIICDGDPGILSGEHVVSALRNYNQYVPIIAQSDVSGYIDRMFNSGATWSVPRTLNKDIDFARLQELMITLSRRFPK